MGVDRYVHISEIKVKNKCGTGKSEILKFCQDATKNQARG